MVDLTGGFKSFVDKAQQKITEIQNDERLRETVNGAVKQAQAKLEEIQQDERVKDLLEQGKEKIDSFRNANQATHQSDGQALAATTEDCSDDRFNLASNSLSAQSGERKWSATQGQGVHTLFTSELGIRGISGQYPFIKNKLVLPFDESTLLSTTVDNFDLKLNFSLADGSTQSVSFSCLNKSNHQEIIEFVINHVEKLSPEMQKTQENIAQVKGKQDELKNYLQSHQGKIVFEQSASYRGGIPGFPDSANQPGQAYILDDSIAFQDERIAWHISYDSVLKAELDLFQVRGSRALLGGAVMTRALQEVKNTVAVTYLAQENVERIAKFQIHGAATIPGEGVKAQEFINRLFDFKGSFAKPESRSASNADDPLNTLKKLKSLEEQGIISKSEFESKKKQLLKRL